MLQQSRITIMLPVKDLDRARQFYEDRIGFQAGSQSADGKFIYACGDAFIALFPKDGGTRADHTAVSFEVSDIAVAIRELQARGVKFEDYDYPGLKTVEHVCVLGAEKAAWFLDTEGNCLCLHEDLH
jgi:catechol 2,3-dioxygenase-like lactoylglutathione lyase family enzyme